MTKALTVSVNCTSTNLSNQPMQNLIARAGFIASGYIHNLDEHDPELIFVKVLT